MIMFAKGRNLPYVQEELCLSKSTVSTHRQHIYQKLGVHSAQEMIDLIQKGEGVESGWDIRDALCWWANTWERMVLCGHWCSVWHMRRWISMAKRLARASGCLVLLGVGADDGPDQIERLWSKIFKLRIFEDENGKTNRSLADVNGQVLIVSQFTLYANCKKGNRPSFTGAGAPDQAERLYEQFVERARQDVPHVETGRFGAMMQVSLVNDGPFTIWLDTDEL